MSGEIVIPDNVEVNGVSEVSDRCRECDPLLVEFDGELSGEGVSPMMGVIPKAEAARLVGRERRSPPMIVEFAPTTEVGRRGDGLDP